MEGHGQGDGATKASPRRDVDGWPALMRLYREAHRRTGTRVLHMFGIPMIVASLVLIPLHLRLAAGLFVGGWICQFAGHYVFEKNAPRFFDGWRNLLVGVAWSGIEWADFFRRGFRRVRGSRR